MEHLASIKPPGRKRPRDDERWFNQASPDFAFNVLQCAQAKHVEARRAGIDRLQWEQTWPLDDGTRADPASHFALREIVWAVLILWRHTTPKMIKFTELKETIVSIAGGSSKEHVASHSRIFTEHGIVPPVKFTPEWAKQAIGAFIVETAHKLTVNNGPLRSKDKTVVANEIKAVLATPEAQQGVRQAYEALVSTLGLQGTYQSPLNANAPLFVAPTPVEAEPSLDDPNVLPAKIRHYLTEENSRKWPSTNDINKITRGKLFNKLTKQNSLKRLFVLTGAPHAGKTSVIVTLLRWLDREFSGHLRLNVKITNRRTKDLPIFMENAQAAGHHGLSVSILAFLKKLANPKMSLCDHKRTVEADFRGTQVNVDGNTIEEEIAIAHRGNPALFIFTNWNDFHPDQNRTLLRDTPKTALIELLIRSEKVSRVILSALPDMTGQSKSLDLPEHHEIKVPNPKFREINRYFRDGYQLDRLDHAWKPIFYANDDAQISGDILLLMATTFQLCKGQSDVKTQVIEAISQCCEVLRTEATIGAEDRLIALLLGELQRRKVLGMVFVVAASVDGVRTGSLKRIFDRWAVMNFSKETPRWESRLRSFEGLKSLAFGFFVKYEPCTHFDPAEFDVDEDGTADAHAWEVDIAIASLISGAIYRAQTCEGGLQELTKHAELSRSAQRQLSNFVRLRARTKRRNTSTIIEPRSIYLMRRDMQCFETLLASIPPNEFQGKPDFGSPQTAGKPAEEMEDPLPTFLNKLPDLLSLSEDVVFATNDDFQSGKAVRYALLQILRREIDHAHELTMLFDFDLIRLRLYLLLWMPSGRRYDESVDQIWEQRAAYLKDGIPDHIRANFSHFEIVDLLTTLALAGYHSQRPGIIDWARNQFEKLLEQCAPEGGGHRDALVARAARIYCSVLDGRIQTGRYVSTLPQKEAKGANTHQDTLEALQSWLKDGYEPFHKADYCLATLTGLFVGDPRRGKAWMRLKAREAELLSLLMTEDGFDRKRPTLNKAHQIYDMLVSLENSIANPADSQYPIIFSGRTARRYIRFLLRSQAYAVPDLNNTKPRMIMDSAIRGLIRINTARLRHYGGADQVSLFVDMSLYTYGKGTPHTPVTQLDEWKENALEYAERALDLCRRGSASHAIELEVLAVLIGQRLEKVQRLVGDTEEKDRMRNLLIDTKPHLQRMSFLAKHLQFVPTQGIALYLKTLWDFLDFQLNVPGDVENYTELMRGSLKEAKEKMEACFEISFAREMEYLEIRIAQLRDQN